MINAFQVDIARYLAIEAMGRRRTTYPLLARAVNWPHPQGRGLGKHLWEVLNFTHELRPVAYGLREPMHTTYLAVCEDATVLAKTPAPPGTKLVKIGVSGDTDRRLRDLNDHHFARIFGLRFRMLATQRWPNQDEALAREAAALEWGLANAAQHASGEYFFMTEQEVMQAVM